ncbi:hypothetical protein BZA77DRAFT_352731 [Pyronema omphalodes]|nr:hypothetical protein BZA77DRAFT_352731 [Pyronema omphalodes]
MPPPSLLQDPNPAFQSSSLHELTHVFFNNINVYILITGVIYICFCVITVKGLVLEVSAHPGFITRAPPAPVVDHV